VICVNVRCYGFGFVGKAYAMLIREQGHSVQVKTADDDTRWEAISKGFGGFTNLYMMSLVGADYDAIVISVPTPTIKNKQDLKVLESILKEIKENHETPYIIIKSTVLPSNITELEKNIEKKDRSLFCTLNFLRLKIQLVVFLIRPVVYLEKEMHGHQKRKNFYQRCLD